MFPPVNFKTPTTVSQAKLVSIYPGGSLEQGPGFRLDIFGRISLGFSVMVTPAGWSSSHSGGRVHLECFIFYFYFVLAKRLGAMARHSPVQRGLVPGMQVTLDNQPPIITHTHNTLLKTGTKMFMKGRVCWHDSIAEIHKVECVYYVVTQCFTWASFGVWTNTLATGVFTFGVSFVHFRS